MNDKVSHSRQWLAKAESDLTAARRLLDVGGPFDAVCFHAQQAAERKRFEDGVPAHSRGRGAAMGMGPA